MKINKVKLEKYVNLKQGLAINKQTNYLISDIKNEEFIYPLLRIADMSEKKFTKYVSKNVKSSVLAMEEDIIYTRTGQIGLAFKGFKGVVHNNSFIVNLINETEINKDYLFCILKSNFIKNQVINMAKNSVQPDLTHDMFKSLVIPLPNKAIQEKIAKLYERLSLKIELNNKINSELEAMAKTIYDYWFLQFEFPNEEGKPYKSSGGKMVWNEELKREIPEGWEVKNLIDYCYLKNGINYNKEETVGEKYKIINVRDISSSSLFVNSNLLDEICISPNIADKYLVNKNDILIARSGSPGQVRIISIKENMIFSGFIIKCEVKESKYKEYFIYVLKKIENLISTKSNGSILKNINQESLNMLKIVIPNMEIIDNFNSKIVSIHKKIENIMEENQELTSLRDFLLPLLMNGQIGFKEE